MEVRHIRSFLAVVRHRTVTDAAIAQHLAPSSLSAQVRQLEASLGTSLVVRSASGMTLTPAGARLAARAPGLLADWDAARLEVIAEPGRLRVVGTEHIVANQVPQVLGELRRRRPELQVEVGSLASRGEVLDAVRSGSADAGLILDVRELGGDWVLAGTDDHQLEFADLVNVPTVLAVAPTHPLAGVAGLTLLDLAEHRIAIGPRVCALHLGVERIFPQLTLERMPSLVIARSWAVHGMAAVMLPAFAIAAEIAAGTLIPVQIDTRPLDSWLRIAWRPAADLGTDRRDLLYAAGAVVAAGSALVASKISEIPGAPGSST
jgi:DNA-binding transcriptional LysR family regulator